MIHNFRHRGLKRLFEDDDARGLPPQFVGRIRQQLDASDAATEVRQLDVPGLGLHPLKGDRQGQWAMTVTRNWRITFEFVGVAEETAVTQAGAYNVNYEDYH